MFYGISVCANVCDILSVYVSFSAFSLVLYFFYLLVLPSLIFILFYFFFLFLRRLFPAREREGYVQLAMSEEQQMVADLRGTAP